MVTCPLTAPIASYPTPPSRRRTDVPNVAVPWRNPNLNQRQNPTTMNHHDEKPTTAPDIEPVGTTTDDPPECDHDFKWNDESFSHEFGTEKGGNWICRKCGEVGEKEEEE